MRKSLLLSVLMLFGFISFSQPVADPYQDASPNAFQQTNSSKAVWDLQFQYNLDRSATAGIAVDTAHFWVTVWSANKVFKYTHAGLLVDSVSIAGSTFPTSGTSYLRDITWDGTYFYGGNATASIYIMDFNTGTCTGTITCPSGTVVRYITYDPTADSGQGGFWVGNWSDGAKLISRTGTQLDVIPNTVFTGLSCYGAAFDTTTANGGPFLWVFSQTNNGNDLVQISLSTKQKTGLVYDITKDVSVPSGSIAGGAFIQHNIITNTTTLGGLVQGQKIFGYNLSNTVPFNNDLAVISLDAQKYHMINQPMQVKGVIQNMGFDTVTSMNINWQIDTGTVYTQSLTGLNLLSFQKHTFTHPDTWTPTTLGTYHLKCWVDSPNGLPDDDPGDDTLVFVISVVQQVIQRLPLHEAFTSSTCVPCVAGNSNLKSIFNANPNKWVCLKYQMSWPGSGDPYFTAEGQTRRTYYGINSVPALVVDAAPFILSSNYTSAMLNTAYGVPSFVTLTADFAQPGDGKTVNINVNIDPAADIPSSSLRLHVAIFEYKTFDNIKSNGETEFVYVMKKMVPNASGTPISSLTGGVQVPNTFSYVFKGDYRLPADATSPINHTTEHSVEEFSDLGVVVWLQDNATKEVFQAAYATKTAGVGEVNNGNGIVALFPNPATRNAWMKYQITNPSDVSFIVYDMNGRVVLTHDEGLQSAGVYDIAIPAAELDSGLYMVKLLVGNKSYNHKMLISR